ncbi:hypothetical protein U1Q18_016212 [Sarracenia purpurea var. burkii]
MKEFSTFKSNSGLVKAIIISGAKIFTGHQDGRIRVWKVNDPKKPGTYKRTGTLPTFMDMFKSLIKRNRQKGDDSGGGNEAHTAETREHGDGIGGRWVGFAGVWSSDGLLNFWAHEKQQLNHGGVLKGHKLAVLCFETTGNMVFNGSTDKTIYVWRRKGIIHSRLSVLTGHTGLVKCLVVNKDRESTVGGVQWESG